MSARMTNPVMIVPDALQAMLGLSKVVSQVGVPPETTELVHLRVSQINGCAPCINMHAGSLGKSRESDERMLMVAAWREAPCFTDAERAALGLAEAVTRLSDRPDPVPDDVWAEAARHYSEKELGALIVGIGLVNLWNRVNVSTRQVPAAGWS
jgi:AhpD family alkylhydroperoxidase